MTFGNDAPLLVYIPTLHRELAPCALPGVRFLDPGLPQTAVLPDLFHPQNLPLTPEQAARALADMLALGEAFDLTHPAGKEAARRSSDSEASLSAEERAGIARFAAPGSSPAATEPAAGLAAQKVLILAWDLEARLLEIAALRQKVADAAEPLADILRNREEYDARSVSLPGTLPENLAELPEPPQTDWRVILAAMAAFIPDNAVLVTCHAALRAALLEAGMLHPLPGDAAERLAQWPEEIRSRLLWTKAPLWRLLGRSHEPKNAPWLFAAPELIICPPLKNQASPKI